MTLFVCLARLQRYVFRALFCLVTAFATTLANADVVGWPNCEFKIEFASGARETQGVQDNATYKIYLSPKGQLPYLKAECSAYDVRSRKALLDSFPQALSAQAKEAGITAPNIQIEKTKLGQLGKFTGTVKSGSHVMRVYGRVLVGERSILMFTAIEENGDVTPAALAFLNSVKR